MLLVPGCAALPTACSRTGTTASGGDALEVPRRAQRGQCDGAPAGPAVVLEPDRLAEPSASSEASLGPPAR